MNYYKVEVRRDSWGYKTFDVYAKSTADAEAKAIALAGDFEFSETGADYDVSFIREFSTTVTLTFEDIEALSEAIEDSCVEDTLALLDGIKKLRADTPRTQEIGNED